MLQLGRVAIREVDVLLRSESGLAASLVRINPCVDGHAVVIPSRPHVKVSTTVSLSLSQPPSPSPSPHPSSPSSSSLPLFPTLTLSRSITISLPASSFVVASWFVCQCAQCNTCLDGNTCLSHDQCSSPDPSAPPHLRHLWASGAGRSNSDRAHRVCTADCRNGSGAAGHHRAHHPHCVQHRDQRWIPRWTAPIHRPPRPRLPSVHRRPQAR
jgi:hypothetical protein